MRNAGSTGDYKARKKATLFYLNIENFFCAKRVQFTNYRTASSFAGYPANGAVTFNGSNLRLITSPYWSRMCWSHQCII